ncbi:MAG: NrtR DNA-binding winged helix domain-containing protein [Anaerolineae bacterium]|nr:hypothetical protein [Ardenticatenia bacterium]MBK8542047.1 hypothetical protein [Ardenticatenia bacterium]HQZ71922.1 hypothetical protein [Anaerolineae bacterium]HRA20506.1 hypothetical protein [Anaerolineae bacterium]
MVPPTPTRNDPVEVSLCAVLFTVRQAAPQVLVIAAPPDPWQSTAVALGLTVGADAAASDALPFGPLDPLRDATLERGLLGWVQRQTGLELDWIEQLYTFGDQYRDPRELAGARAVAVAYLAIVDAEQASVRAGAHWRDIYRLLPWEDWRAGRPAPVLEVIVPSLANWVADAPDATTRAARRERADIAFGLGPASWDADRVLDRYELLYELGLVAEAHVDAALRRANGVTLRHAPWQGLPAISPSAPPDTVTPPLARATLLGQAMLHDHRRILATALGRLRGKLRYRPVVFELLPPAFTLSELQRVVESLTGQCLHAANFRRLLDGSGLVEDTGKFAPTGGRPARRYRFRREVLKERRAPGLGLARRRRGGGASFS